MDHDAWGGLVAGAVARIKAGALGKVVLARQIDVRANRPFVTSDVLARLLALCPTCMVFRIDGFLSACPELLLYRRIWMPTSLVDIRQLQRPEHPFRSDRKSTRLICPTAPNGGQLTLEAARQR